MLFILRHLPLRSSPPLDHGDHAVLDLPWGGETDPLVTHRHGLQGRTTYQSIQ